MDESDTQTFCRLCHFGGGIDIRADELRFGAITNRTGEMHKKRCSVAGRDDCGFAKRSDRAFDTCRDRPTAFRPHQGANAPAAVAKPFGDVPTDEAGGSRHRDDAAHTIAF